MFYVTLGGIRMNRLDAAILFSLAVLVAVIAIPAAITHNAQPGRLKQIEDCLASGGTPVVGHTAGGSNITSVYCAGTRR